ncbi:MAG: RNA methyltransferase, partial [Rubrobacteridae bacterium]|nr:RNA methyltransferase [Rubrobacteridae bacterium]
RTANKVLIPIAEFVAASEDQLYKGALKINWREHLELGMTFAVDAGARNSKITHSKYAALKVKDAIADQFRNSMGKRPDVNPTNPDILINVHISKDVCTISLDSSGDSLHKRGYRVASIEAPMRETLAAMLVEISEWDLKTPLVDPMCGSGTILIEAALKATNTAPGLLRKKFGFKRWMNFNKKAWDDLVRDAERKSTKKDIPMIIGLDNSKKALDAAAANIKAAGLSDVITLKVSDIKEFSPPQGPGTIIVNPPYGERIGDKQQLEELYKTLGDVFKQHCKGYTAYIFTGNLDLAKRVGLKTSRRIPLYNGPIESRFLKYDLY